MMMPKAVVFDLDGTLAESKQAIEKPMPELLSQLLARTNVGVISGGALAQFLKQVVSMLPVDADLRRLHILPTSGAALYEYDNGDWKKVYEERLSEKDKDEIETAMREAAEKTRTIDFKKPSWGERIEFRGGQVTLSALGQQAPLAEKKAWDPDHKKRIALQAELAKLLPRFSVGIGGATSIDVTKRGIDKAYGLHALCARLKIPESKALYVGDELEHGGNDEAVYKTDAETARVANPEETARFIRILLAEEPHKA